MPYAYVIVDIKVNDPEQYRQYMAQAPATIAAAGGEYLVRGGQHAVLEGSWQPDRLAMLRFSSMAATQAWYDGERYRAARATRAGATEFFNMVVIEGAPGRDLRHFLSSP